MKNRNNGIWHFLRIMLLMVLGIFLAPSLWMGLPALAVARSFARGRSRRLAKMIVGSALIWFVMMESAMLTAMIGQTLSPDRLSGTETMIIPGAAVINDRPGAMLQSRLDAAIPILESYPGMMVIVSGGRSPEDPSSEAHIMKAYLVQKGISPGRIFEEPAARDTIGNLEYSSQLITAYGLNEKVILVSSEFHSFRSAAIAQASGLDPVNRSGLSPPWVLLKYMVREFASLIKVQLHYGLNLQW